MRRIDLVNLINPEESPKAHKERSKGVTQGHLAIETRFPSSADGFGHVSERGTLGPMFRSERRTSPH